jgi:hypothetical protein
VDGPIQLADGESAGGPCSVKLERIGPDHRYGLRCRAIDELLLCQREQSIVAGVRAEGGL